MKKKYLVPITLILVLLVGGCAGGEFMSEEPMVGRTVVETVVVEKEVEVAYAPEPGMGDSAIVADMDETLNTTTQNRMIIYTVNIELIVQDAAEALEQIGDLSEEMGGYISGSSSWKDKDQLRARITLRVPADRLDQTLDQMRDLALDVESSNRDSSDVTEEFVNLDARLRNLETTEGELLELLKTRQESTGDTEAILEVHRYLTEIRGQIEQIEGRMNYLSNLTAMATIHVTLTPDVLAQPLTVGGWQPEGTALQAIQALINAFKFLIDALIWILLFIVPVLLVILLPLFIILRALVRWRRKRRRPTS